MLLIRKLRFTIALASIGAAAGCGSTPSPQPPAIITGPHSGTTIRLPEDKGFVEVLNEPEVGERDTKPTAIVAYYLQSDGKSALTPAPTQVTFELKEGDRGSKVVPLTAGSEGRFTSKPGPYNISQIHGMLKAEIAGQTVTTQMAGGR